MTIETQTADWQNWIDTINAGKTGLGFSQLALMSFGRFAYDNAPALLTAASEAERLRAENAEFVASMITLDAVVHALGIEDSTDDPVAAIEALQSEIDVLKAERASLALPAPAQAEPVAWQATHRHLKRGSTYRVIGEATAQAADYITDHMRCVVYAAQDGTIWVRSKSEFEDGRFERVAAPPPPAGEG